MRNGYNLSSNIVVYSVNGIGVNEAITHPQARFDLLVDFAQNLQKVNNLIIILYI